MKVLVINAGSSSIKFKLFYSKTEELLAEGELRNHIGGEYIFELKFPEEKQWSIRPKDFEYPFDYILEQLESKNLIENFSEIKYIAHRIVHGGEEFSEAVELTDKNLESLDKYTQLAPLHNPVSLKIVNQVKEVLPQIKQYGVFDTSFHLTNKKEKYLYGLPYGYYENIKVRRYGFHGLSYEYILERLKEKEIKTNKVVICHLGSGSSIAAIKDGISFDHSFGFSPNENLIMSTRVGEIDFDAVKYIKEKLDLDDKSVEQLLNKESGLLGISGYTKDMKQLIDDYDSNDRAKLAIDMYLEKVLDHISRFFIGLEGIETLVFTGGVGYAAPFIREKVCNSLKVMGVDIDTKKNMDGNYADFEIISKSASKTQIVVAKTNEELQILRDVEKIAN